MEDSTTPDGSASEEREKVVRYLRLVVASWERISLEEAGNLPKEIAYLADAIERGAHNYV